MSERIFTLFGEEIVPEQPKAQPKSRAKKKKDEEHHPEQPTDAEIAPPATTEQPVAEITDTHVIAEPETVAAPVVAETPAEPTAEVGPTIETEAVPEVNVPEATEQPEVITSAEEEVEVLTEPVATEETQPEADPAETQPGAEVKKTKKSKEVIKPEEPTGDKQYYTIGEVADLFKVKTSHIRFWTTEFKLKVRTTRKGDRLYNNDAIKELRAIHHLVKERGFTLAGAKTKLKEQKQVEVEAVDLKKSLTQLRNKLVAIKNQLK